MNESFEIKLINDKIMISKDDCAFCVDEKIDGDIWFTSSNGNISFPINNSFKNNEYECYNIFEELMKSIIGRYILSGDAKDKYGILPSDFIDLDNKIIIWHSDSEIDDILKIQYEKGKIIISLIGNKNNIKVRIRKSGSEYGFYYQEFTKFYRELSDYAYNKNNNISKIKRI